MGRTTLEVIGCGDAFGTEGRLNTCFLVKSPKINFLIDCGASSLPALKRAGHETNDISAIIITHFHGDHFGGVPFFLLDAAVMAKRRKKLKIISPPGGEKIIKKLFNSLYPNSSKLLSKLKIEYLNYSSQPVKTNGMVIKAFPVKHSKASKPYALNIKMGKKVIGYSGDCEWNDNLILASQGTDLFVCECNFYKKKVPGHMNYFSLLENKAKLGCRKLKLTHLGEEMIQNIDLLEADCLEEGRIYNL